MFDDYILNALYATENDGLRTVTHRSKILSILITNTEIKLHCFEMVMLCLTKFETFLFFKEE